MTKGNLKLNLVLEKVRELGLTAELWPISAIQQLNGVRPGISFCKKILRYNSHIIHNSHPLKVENSVFSMSTNLCSHHHYVMPV